MNLIDIPNGQWESVCCDVKGHTSCEVSIATGYLRIRAKNVEDNTKYEILRFGLDMMPTESDYPNFKEISESDLRTLINT